MPKHQLRPATTESVPAKRIKTGKSEDVKATFAPETQRTSVTPKALLAWIKANNQPRVRSALDRQPGLGRRTFGEKGYDVLKYATYHGIVWLFEIAWALPRPVDDYYSLSLLHVACMGTPCLPIVTFLTSRYPTSLTMLYGGCSCTPLCLAAEQGSLDVVKHLVEVCRASVNAGSGGNRRTPLWYAVQGDKWEVFEYLLSHPEVDIHQPAGERPVFIASQKGHLRMVKSLLSSEKMDLGLLDNLGGDTPVMAACANGHLPVVVYLSSLPHFSVNALGKSGATALYIAAQNGFMPIVQYLVESRGANVNLLTKENGCTALIAACCEGNLPMVEYLGSLDQTEMEQRAGPYFHHGGQDTSDGMTPLMSACKFDRLLVVKSLLSTGRVQINATSNSGKTPLDIVAEKGFLKLVRLLLHRGGKFTRARATPLMVSVCLEATKGILHKRYLQEHDIPSAVTDLILDYVPEMCQASL